MCQSIEVLVVDDNEDFASECVEFIESKCQVGAKMALNDQEALKDLKQYSIKIILLDYDMPVTGLSLFPELKKIDSKVKIVFISSVATADILFKANKLDFAARISKFNCYNELPELIPTLLLEYSKDIPVSGTEFYKEYRHKLFKSFSIAYSLLSYKVIEKEYIFPESWMTSQMIFSGETHSEKEELDFEKTFNFSDNFKITSDVQTGFSNKAIMDIKSSLSTQLESELKSEYTEKIKGAISWMRELSLPDDKQLISRFYDFAKVYSQIKVLIKKTCSCCDSVNVYPLTVYFPIPSIAYRIREYYDDGREPKTIDSGIYKS